MEIVIILYCVYQHQLYYIVCIRRQSKLQGTLQRGVENTPADRTGWK